MFRNPRRIRPVLAAVLLAGAIASPVAVAAPIKPTDNTGTVADGETRADPAQCQMYYDWYRQDVNNKDKAGAEYTKDLADRRGCRWAERLVARSTTQSSSDPGYTSPAPPPTYG